MPLKEGLPPFLLKGFSIFVSYAMQEKNKTLYDLVSRFLKAMGFTIVSATESLMSDAPPGDQISQLIGESNALLAILTKDNKLHDGKDTKFHPSPNVIDEIGQAADKPTIIVVEEGTEVPSNIQTRETYMEFKKTDYGEMLVKLIEKIKKAGMV